MVKAREEQITGEAELAKIKNFSDAFSRKHHYLRDKTWIMCIHRKGDGGYSCKGCCYNDSTKTEEHAQLISSNNIVKIMVSRLLL